MRRTRHRVTFETIAELDAIVMAKLGMSDAAILESTPFTKHQISYRLHKGKVLEGMGKGQTYRSEWRNGTGEAVQAVLGGMRASLRSETKQTLAPLIGHPTPETTKGQGRNGG